MMQAARSLYLVILVSLVGACSAGKAASGSHAGSGASGGAGAGLNLGGGPGLNLGGGTGMDVDAGDGANPQTCVEAAAIGSYVGCDFWPTIVANPVWVEFDPAVVIANGSMTDAQVTIDGPNAFHQAVTVPAGGLQTVLLKWVMGLKGPEFDVPATTNGRLTTSARVDKGAYHLTSTAPVTAWQFNPLQYTKPGSACPRIPGLMECRSSTVDASLLLPATAMTGHYRFFGYSGHNEGSKWGSVPSGAAITATADNTTVQVQLGPKCGAEVFGEPKLGACVAAGTGVESKNAGDIYTLQMNAGDVVELVGVWAKDELTMNADLSGSVVSASAPVQVISFNAIAQLPDQSVVNGDHMEETVLPAEVIGNKYVVVPPTTPNGNAVGHVVRIYGNVDNTHLTYSPASAVPADAPTTINAGDVFQIPTAPKGVVGPECVSASNHCMINTPFVVTGDQPFAVASFMVGGTLQMPGTDSTNSQGDPGMSMEVTPQQFRKQYTFLAPVDYKENFADIIVPTGAPVTLDGMVLSTAPTPIDAEWGFIRAPLANTNGGVHTLTSTAGIGLQVMGFGYATSYYYPGGLNLIHISDPPPIVVK